MILAGRFDMTVNRWQPATYIFLFKGLDFAFVGADFMVRPYRDASGLSLIHLTNATDGGITITSETVDNLVQSTVTIAIPQASIDALPFTSPRGADLKLAFDFMTTGGGLDRTRWMEGDFIVHAGVSRDDG